MLPQEEQNTPPEAGGRTGSEQAMNIGTPFFPAARQADEPGGRLRRIEGARRVLRQMDVSCERYSPVGPGRPAVNAERDVWLTSGLLYFVTAADSGAGLAAHSRSAARYAVLLARALGISREGDLLDIERGALLHDVGKAAVPRSILVKNGALTTLEREVVREHPFVGYKMIEDFVFLKRASRIVLCHHERFDGRGYPLGLAGDAIPLEARIFALADTLDAMTTDRAYRRGRSFEGAAREIGELGGRQFDPAVTEVFMSIPTGAWRRAGADAAVRFRTPLAH
jgi:putative nucleotidyltransferase with HDIG domain